MQEIQLLTKYAHIQAQLYAEFWKPYAIGFAVANTLLLTLLCACAISAWRAAYASRDVVIQTRRAAQASLLSQLLSEYASARMQKAIRELHRWRRAHPDDFKDRFIALLEKQNPEGDRLDGHRRYTYRFFHKIRSLCQAGLIEPEWLHFVFTNEVVARFLNEILEPLQEKHNEAIVGIRYDKELFDYYRGQFSSPTVVAHSTAAPAPND